MYLKFAYMYICSYYFVAVEGDYSGYTLEQVQAVIRHGDRAPLHFWKNYELPVIPCRWHDGLKKFKTEYEAYKQQFQKKDVCLFFDFSLYARF